MLHAMIHKLKTYEIAGGCNISYKSWKCVWISCQNRLGVSVEFGMKKTHLIMDCISNKRNGAQYYVNVFMLNEYIKNSCKVEIIRKAFPK